MIQCMSLYLLLISFVVGRIIGNINSGNQRMESQKWSGMVTARKVMTNRDSILKSRDITLPTKVHLVKAMVFPVVIYGCESC